MFKFFLRVAPRLHSHPIARSSSKKLQPTSLLVSRNLHTTVIRRDSSFTNLLADDNPPPVQVSSLSDNGILLADGLLIPGACIFLGGKVYLWDTPELKTNTRRTQEIWRTWAEERFQIFDIVTPRPGEPLLFKFSVCIHELGWLVEILLFGTGRTLIQPPPFIQAYLGTLGIQLDVMDTVCTNLYFFLSLFYFHLNSCFDNREMPAPHITYWQRRADVSLQHFYL